jgi:hypothetical protein
MNTFGTRFLPILLLGVVLAVVASAVTFTLLASGNLPDGPVAVVWDKAACAACGMHVGEPPFAAQLTTKDGKTLVFDDPGCLFLHLEENALELHAVWFRDHKADQWHHKDKVAFVPLAVTPMGFGLGAVAAGTPGAIGYDEARRRCLEHTGGHGGGR